MTAPFPTFSSLASLLSRCVVWRVSSSSSVEGSRSHTPAQTHTNTLRARHTRLFHPHRGKVSAPASAMNNWVMWLRAEIAISLISVKTLLATRDMGTGATMWVYTCNVCASVCYMFRFLQGAVLKLVQWLYDICSSRPPVIQTFFFGLLSLYWDSAV